MNFIKSKVEDSYYPSKWFVFDGIAYTPHGWFGCQLKSYERTKPSVNDRRILRNPYRANNFSYTLELYSVKRIGLFLYECSWRLPQRESFDKYSSRILKMLDDLSKL